VARALIVGCGCRGRELGARLAEEGWAVRGTSRSEAGLAAIEAAGIEAAPADPSRPGTVLDLVGDVAVVYWLLASASGERERVAGLHGERLEHLLLRLVDTPVRGFVYEAEGSVPAELLREGEAQAGRAAATWHVPVAFLRADPGDVDAWLAEAAGAGGTVLSRRG
jgi:3-hydroxyisobutyrate dehydrogenase-like beta-hydroxyacid dehydrogenase